MAAQQRVYAETGTSLAHTTLSAVTGASTGTPMDCGAAMSVCTVVVVGTATLAGTVTIEGSLDGSTWVSTGTTAALTAAGTVTASSADKAFRWYRASLSSPSGSGTATAKLLAGV